MALQQPFSDQFGNDYPEAYWKLTGFEYSNEQKQARLTFSCYVSKAASDAGKNSLTTRSIQLTGQLYEQLNQQLTEGFKGQAYELAKAYAEQTSEHNEAMKPIEVRPFEGAKDV